MDARHRHPIAPPVFHTARGNGGRESLNKEESPMNPVDDGGAGRDMRFAFGGLGLCILAALIVTLLF
jgi:hypothetical protein